MSEAVGKLVTNVEFQTKHKSKCAPLAVLALATEVSDKIVRHKDKDVLHECFDGLEMIVPPCHQHNNPHCHSTSGAKLLCVDWERMFNVQVPCPDANCTGALKTDRTNFSKNQTLFPTFGLDGSPCWCIVVVLVCPCCRRRFSSNEADVLVNLPEHAASACPVETTCALPSCSCHLSRNAAEVFSTIVVTCGNGELCSKLLFNAINRDCIQRLKVHCSVAKQKKGTTTTMPYPEKDGTVVKQCPPLGDSIRDMHDAAATSQKNAWCVSDHDRHIREIQSVGTTSIFCQDHAFQVIKNHMKGVRAKAVWDTATGTGEIASAVLAPSTETEDFAHAAQQSMKRGHFKPKAKCSDTWPSKKECWESMCPGIEGRLGLFHFQKRIVSTLKKNHIDCTVAVTDLLASLCVCCSEDCEQLLAALKNGSLSRSGKKHSLEEISDMKRSSVFRDRYSKCLRKQLHQPETTNQMLDDRFCKHNVTSSDPTNKPAQGRLDPDWLEPLFASDTKPAIENCKEKACHLSDPLSLEDMHDKILPNPNSTHQLTEFLSLRGESKLEAFHDRFAHFANCGMRNSLADNLNLAGTARHNLATRHKRSLVSAKNPMENTPSPQRKKLPAAWEKVAPHFSHSELWCVNNMAAAVGCLPPFPMAEALPDDNGERFFSEHMTITVPSLKGIWHGEFGECLCALCSKMSTKPVLFTTTIASPKKTKSTTINTTTIDHEMTTTTTTTTSLVNNVNIDVSRQQASWPQQPASSVANALNAANNMAMHAALGGAPCCTPIAPPIPMQHQIPCCHNMMQQQIVPCCNKCAQWLTKRQGRPPHHPLCPRR